MQKICLSSNLDETIKYLEKISKTRPNYTIYYRLAKAYRKKKNLDKALFYVEKAFLFQKENPHLFLEASIIWEKFFQRSKEPSDLKKAIIFHKKSSFQSYYKLGVLYYKMGCLTNDDTLYEKAISYFQKIKKKNKKNFYKIAKCYKKLFYNNSFPTLQKTTSFYFEKSFKNLEYIDFLIHSGKILEKEHILQKAVSLCKNHPHYLFQIKFAEALCSLGLLKDDFSFIKKAEKITASLIKKYPKASAYPHAMVLKSFSRYFQDPFFEKKAIYFLKKSPKKPFFEIAVSYSNLYLGYEKFSDMVLAKKYFQKALSAHPTSSETLFTYSNFLYQTSNNIKALKIIEKIKKRKNPKYLFLYALIKQNLGMKYENTQYIKEAIYHMETLLSKDPKIHFPLALCYSYLGELHFSENFLTKALKNFQKASSVIEEEDLYLEWGTSLILAAEILENPSLYSFAGEKLLKAASLGCERAYYYLGCLFSITKSFDLSLYFLKKAKKAEVLPPLDEMKEDIWLENIQKEYRNFLIDLH